MILLYQLLFIAINTHLPFRLPFQPISFILSFLNEQIKLIVIDSNIRQKLEILYKVSTYKKLCSIMSSKRFSTKELTYPSFLSRNPMIVFIARINLASIKRFYVENLKRVNIVI